MTNEETFDKEFKRYGGRCPDVKLLTKIREISKEMIEDLGRIYPNMPPIHFDILNNHSVNGFAAYADGRYYIGITNGFLLVTYDLFWKIMSSRTTLTHISENINNLPDDQKISITHNKDGINHLDDPNLFKPFDSIDRLTYVQVLCNHVHAFMLYHEYGHILRGHSGLKASLNNSSKSWFQLSNPSSVKETDSLLSQTLEMDADSFAINRLYNNFSQILKNGAIAMPQIYRKYFSSWKEVTYASNFAIYCLFKLFGWNEYDLEKAKNSFSHPPPPIRMALMSGNIATLFIERHGKEHVNEIVKADAWQESESAFSKVSHFPLNKHIYLKTFEKESQDYIRLITSNWNKLRPLLEPFAFSQLPPFSKL